MSISRRYARALLEAATEAGQQDAILAELEALAVAADESAELRSLLESPTFSRAQKKSVLVEIADANKLSPLTKNFLSLLADRDRTAYLASIARIYRDLADKAAGRVRAEVKAPYAIADADARRLQDALSKATGLEVAVTTDVDPSVLGGVVARVGDLTFDGSLKTQLKTLRDQVLENA